MSLTPDPYEEENAPDAGHGIEGSEVTNDQEGESMTIVDPITDNIDWISFEEPEQTTVEFTVEARSVDSLFVGSNVVLTVEGRVDDKGTVPFVAVRTDLEAFLGIDEIDQLIAALAWARQDLMRVQGGLR